MSLSLSAVTLALAPGISTSFGASQGTSPYTYSVQSGGAGGTINASSGLYTAPANTGLDTVEVTDGADSTASLQILVGTALELFCDIIQTFMGLSQGQVYLYNQKINLPTDERLYIAVGVLSCKPFGNSNKLDVNGNSIQSVNMHADLSVDILSRGPDALNLKEQVLLALMSYYAQSQQAINSFYVGKVSTGFVNLSEIEGSAIPYRFNITVPIQYFVQKQTTAQYFDDFGNQSIYPNF